MKNEIYCTNNGWNAILERELNQKYFFELSDYLERSRKKKNNFPQKKRYF